MNLHGKTNKILIKTVMGGKSSKLTEEELEVLEANPNIRYNYLLNHSE